VISGELVDLKPIDSGDYEFLLRWNNDPEYAGPFEPFEAIPKEELRGWLANMPVNPLWFIIQTKRGRRVGQMRVTLMGDHAEIGYRVAPPSRGRGYCTDAVKAITGHLFALHGVEYVEAEVNPGNAASLRVLEKAGFLRTGYKERAVEVNGVWMGGVVYTRWR
jgi:RimJ/RimL family protein N-acetyltransferase